MKKNPFTIYLLMVVSFTNAQNDNLRQYLYTQKDYVNNQLRNRDSMVSTYPNLSERLKSEDTWFLWNIPGQTYLNSKRNMYTYNAAGQTTEYKVQEWDGGNWANIRKWNYTYNSQGSIILSNTYYFQNGNWIEQNRGEWTYNSQGSIIEYQGSDTVGGTLSVKSRNVYTVDGLQRTKETVSQNYVSGNWLNNTRTVNYFTGNATLIDSTYYYNWNASNNIWIPDFKVTYKYNAQGAETEYYRFNLATNKPQLKTVRDYNAAGKLLYTENYQWDNNNNQWYLGSKNTSSYDSKNREVESIFYTGSSTGLQFNSKTDVVYTTDSSSIQFIGSTWVNNGWQPNAEYAYYFEQRQTASDILAIQDGSIKIYPNPLTKHAFIEFESKVNDEANIQIYDGQGRQVHMDKRFTAPGKNSFWWNALDKNNAALPSGMYFLKLSLNNQSFYTTLLKQ